MAREGVSHDELIRSNARLRLLADVSRAFAEIAPGHLSLVQTIARAMADHVGDGCVVLLRDPIGEGLVRVADAHRDPSVEADCRSLAEKMGVWQITSDLPVRVARTGVPVLVSDVQPDMVLARVNPALKPLAARLQIRSVAVVALRARSRILGTMALVRSQPSSGYTPDDLSLLQELADRAGLAIENVRLYEEAHQRASELKSANDALRQHAALLANMPDAVISTDAQLRIRDWNLGAEQLFGWSRSDVLSKSADEIVGTGIRDASSEELFRRLLTDGRWAGERRLMCKDGSRVLALISAAALNDDREQTVGILLIIRDISKQRQNEEAARRLAALVESSDDAIQSMTPEGIIQTWNRGAERLYGYSAQEAIGRHISMVAPGKTDAQQAIIDQVCRGERIGSFEAVRMRKDGSTIDISLTVSSIRDDAGQLTAIAGIARDISERRKLEKQLSSAERMASVGMLAAGIAHEINNPLMYVLSNLEVVLADLADSSGAPRLAQLREHTEMLRDAQDGAERIARIVRGLKGFSRTQAEPHVPLSLKALLEAALRLAQGELEQSARIVRELGQTPAVLGDEGSLVQVFVNLLINAAHALPEGRREHNEIRIVTRTDESGRPVVEIRDNGTGIPDAIAGKLFQPFVTTKPVGKGSGLGLSICQRIVATHGGEIRFDTTLGQGTTFYVVLPAALVEAQAAAASPEPALTTAGAGRRGKIMVVDDEPFVGDALDRILSKEHDVIVCHSGRAALDLIDAGERFDGILCDLVMPGLTGIDVHTSLKASAPGQAERMVFLTGGVYTPATRAFLDSVGNSYLGKPFKAHEVRAVVGRIIRDMDARR